MGTPEHTAMHNYAYHPSVANWVHSTSLAQLDGTADESTEQSPDDFYKSTFHRPADYETGPHSALSDMTTTRQRQQTSNGAVRSTPKPSVRSASGPAASSLAATRPTAPLPGNRPTVKSLAQKFNQPSSAESSPSSSRVRPTRPTSSVRSITDTAAPRATSSSSPARPAKEANYGAYKFNNLKPRERPQPAPASPASVRRLNSRTSLEGQTTPSRKNLASSAKNQGRQPFFGEVVGDHGTITPGYGIPNVEPAPGDQSEPTTQSKDSGENDDSHLTSEQPLPAKMPVRHRRSPSDNTTTPAGETRRRSPPSRIPVASRRWSAASDSSSSNRSLKAGSARPNGGYSRTSPSRSNKMPAGTANTTPRKSKASAQPTLPAVSYRGYRERGKSPQDANTGASLAAVITAPPPPTSPRLRNSRERQLLPQESPGSRPRSADPHTQQSYFEDGNGSRAPHEVDMMPSGHTDANSNSKGFDTVVEDANECNDLPTNEALQPEQSTNGYGVNSSVAHQQPLTLHTSKLDAPHVPAPLSSITDFEYEESPILGMPGSFLMTPPIAQSSPPMESGSSDDNPHQSPPTSILEGELLQARTFRKDLTTDNPNSEVQHTTLSEFGIRESIPIMLGADEPQQAWGAPASRPRHSPRLSIGAHKWRAEPFDASGTTSFLEEDSPIDPFANRGSLRPDDSASVAFYRQVEHRAPDWTPKIPTMPEAGRLTLDTEAYSVINKVLNLYHESATITPEVAHNSQKQVQSVSPVIAQYEDWGSKEATETYLARLLSDATVSEEQKAEDELATAADTSHATKHRLPSTSIHELEEDPAEPDAGGTAIIFPPESRRYSRGSRGSTTTTIWEEDGSRADSSSVTLARDSTRDDVEQNHLPAFTYVPHPPPKDLPPSPPTVSSQLAGDHPRSSHERPAPAFHSLLPEIEGAGEGLGLSLQSGQHEVSHSQHYPRAPSYSPPPPPVQQSINQAAHQRAAAGPYTPSVYARQPPSSIFPSAPLPATMASFHRNQHYNRLDEGEDALALQDDTPAANSMSPEHTYPTADTEATAHAISATDSTAVDTAAAGTTQAAVTTSTPPVVGVTVQGPNVDPVTQSLRRRYRIIEELVKTENLFCVDMMVAHSIFEEMSGDVLTDRERRLLFSNSGEIEKLSHALYRSLKRAARPIVNPEEPPPDPETLTAQGYKTPDESIKLFSDEPWDEFVNLTVENDRTTDIGAVMNEYIPRLERLFTTYLLNHEDASNFIKKNQTNGTLLGWVAACFLHSKDLTNAWDLDSLLVKPVQRLLKYPLLLDELEKATAPDHPDLPAIKAARQEIIQISVRINQAKKRQETLREATKEGKKEKSKGLLDGRLGKKFVTALSSKADRTKQQAGAAAAFTDGDYDFLSQKFGGHFFQVQIVIRDIENYLDTLTEFICNTNIIVISFITMMESAPSSNPELESTWRRQAMAMFELQNVALEDHKMAVRTRVLKPILELWALHSRPQKLMDQRKKGLQSYVKYKQALDRKEKVDQKLDDTAQSFLTINNTLKDELPKLYTLTKKCVQACLISFKTYQQDWWKNCQKKMLPLLEYEPEHTTSITYDFKAYVDRFHSDFTRVEATVNRLHIVNHTLLNEAQNYMSPLPSLVSDDTSSRKSSSRRTESMSSDMSMVDSRNRYSGGYNNHRVPVAPPRSAPATQAILVRDRADRGTSPASDSSDATITMGRMKVPVHYSHLDGAFDDEYAQPAAMGASFLNTPISYSNSSRTSGVFSSALPMSDGPVNVGSEEHPATPADLDEPEVLFLAASLFEFNIAHDRREGGIPYLVYVPGEIFDVIGMKGELWLARNQDDPSRTVGWIWEKHFARILPEEM